MAKKVSRLECRVYLEVNGTRYECASISMNWAINTIPTALCSLAIGRDAQSLQVAPIHYRADELQTSTLAKIVFTPKGEWNPQDDRSVAGKGRWDEAGEQTIFLGRITGFGYRKIQGSIRPTVSLVHWLADLSFSSALSNQSHPSNPYKFNWRSSYGTSRGVQADVKLGFIAEHAGPDVFSAQKIGNDFWKQSLHDFFCRLTEVDVLTPNSAESCFHDPAVRSNSFSAEALRRFETHEADADELGQDCAEGSGSPYWRPLPIGRANGGDGGLISDSIATALRRMLESDYFNSTLWDNLTGMLAGQFGFIVVPRVQSAIVAPYVPGLRQTFDSEYRNNKTLDLRDVTYMDSNCLVPRPIRAVGVLLGTSISETGAFIKPAQTTGGCFAPQPLQPGMVLYRQPPFWLNNVPFHVSTPEQTGAFNPVMFASATTPATPQPVQDTAVDVAVRMRDYYDDYAHFLYAQEMLRGRYAVIQGKLRFDLAPGTNVRLVNQSPLFVYGDALSQDMVGTVMRVGINIDAESKIAGTVFQLEHMRTVKENEDERTSIDRHPMYDSVYTGAPLIHEYLFPE